MTTDEKAWQPLELVKVSADYLAGKNCPSPRLDAEVLLCHVLGLGRRVDLYAGFDRKISGKELSAYRELIRRRAAREPVSRILGRRDFMGLSFAVTPEVLSPRPETEILVEAALEKLSPSRKAVPPEDETAPEPEPENGGPEEGPEDELVNEELERLLDSYAADVDSEEDLEKDSSAPPASKPVSRPVPKPMPKPASRPAVSKEGLSRSASIPSPRILDLGTGSGCIAAGLASRLYDARVVAVDASPKALSVAKKNASGLGLSERIEFRQGDWFSACREGELFDVIVSNPPYLVEGDSEIWPEVSAYDPPLALYGGRDGLDCYRRIIPSAPDWLARGGWVFFEVGAGQAETVREMLTRRGFRGTGTLKDYGGVERVVFGQAPEL